MVAGVVTNAGLIVFTMDVLDEYEDYIRYWVFILFQWAVYGFQSILMALVPDIPEEVAIQTERSEYFVSKLIDKEKETEDAEDNALPTTDQIEKLCEIQYHSAVVVEEHGYYNYNSSRSAH